MCCIAVLDSTVIFGLYSICWIMVPIWLICMWYIQKKQIFAFGKIQSQNLTPLLQNGRENLQKIQELYYKRN